MNRKTIILAALALTASASTVSAQQITEQDPSKHVVRTFPLNEKHLQFHSDILGVDKSFSVILPKSYDSETDRKYPVVYLLHGHGENDWEWANINVAMINEQVAKCVADGSAAEMIIVKPNATEYQSGYFNQEGWRYEDYFFNELIPAVESNFRVIADKGHRAIGGLSMGGGGSFYYAVRHPEMFSSVYAISAAVGIGNSSTSSNSTTTNTRGVSPNIFNSRTDLTALSEQQIEALKSVAFTLDIGDDDFLFDSNVATYQQMKKLGLNCQFRVGEGTHATYYWYDALGKALVYWTRHFSEQCK